MQVVEVPLDTVWEMRQKVMYPHLSLEEIKLEEDNKGMHWGIREDDRFVSVVSLFQNGHEWQFRKFATLKELQGRGYGTLLLKWLIGFVQQKGATKLWCNARVNALGFYKKQDFEPFGEIWNQLGFQFVKMQLLFKRNMEIIPAIDIIEGKCVRLTQGDYAQKTVYNENPLEVALEFQDAGLKRLHLVDLDGAKAGAVKNWKVLETIAGKTGMVIDFGGGIKTEKDVDIVLNSGAALATFGSIAVKNKESLLHWMKQFGAEKFLLGADVKEGKIAISGWLEETDIEVVEFIRAYKEEGIQQVFCTDVSKDGLLQGPSTELYKEILDALPGLHFIASGGVSTLKDLEDLQQIGCAGAIVGKAIYEGRITLQELKKFQS